MGFKSAKNTSNVNQSNGKYEVDDIIFYSKFVFETIQSIDEYLRSLYTKDSDKDICEIINYTIRDDEKYFDEILGRVEELIKKINKIDDWFNNVLYEGKFQFSFLNKFKGLNNFLEECEFSIEYNHFMVPQNNINFEKRIIKINNSLSEMRIYLRYD